MSFLLKATGKTFSSEINLPISKSIANRLLMLKALCGIDSNFMKKEVPNDVLIFHDALNAEHSDIDIRDAGTAMRFATAFYSMKKGDWNITGTNRMFQRPIKPLVDGLIGWGADIQYLKNEGYPPLKIKGAELQGGTINIDAGISSQFISALLMIAPLCANTTRLILEGKQASKPYIDMTINMMQMFGVDVERSENELIIQPSEYKNVDVKIERDWSSASFFYLLCALSQEGVFHFPGLNTKSIQGDKHLIDIFKSLGVSTTINADGLTIQKIDSDVITTDILDFSEHPDLFLPVVTACAGLGRDVKISGLFNLHLKESNRLDALVYNLQQINATLNISGSNATLFTSNLPKRASFKVFDDHRMAMSMAMLSVVLEEVEIDQMDVVSKSFPNFWKELEALGVGV